jgi:hypothetical protein
VLKHEITQHRDEMRARAHNAQQRIVEDDDGLPRFTQASQNIAAAVALLRGLTTPEGHQAQREIRALLEHTAMQQAESSASRRRNASQHASLARHGNDASILQPPRGRERPVEDRSKATSVHQPAHDGEKAASAPVHGRLSNNRDMCDTLNAHMRGREEQRGEANHHYNPRRDDRYDSGKD